MPSASPSTSNLFADPEPSRIDREAFLFMGADPAWTPAKEYGNPKVDPDHRLGQPCILCHGDGAEIPLPDGTVAMLAGEIREGSHRVCGRCMKYGLDHRLGLDAKSASDPDLPVESRPGYVMVTRGGSTIEVPDSHAKQLKG